MATRITDVRSSSARAPLSDAARAWAEGVDFRGTALRRLQIARTKAPTTGPEALQRAFRLHSTWAANDLGSVRLYRAPIDARAVFALHTTTDGDAGFLELFSERGALLATGVTGVRDDGRGRFRPTITWDDVPGAVRATIAPREVSPAVPEFQDAIGRARTPGSPSGRTVAGPELVGAAKGLVGDELTPASVDGFENAAIHAVLADASVKLTASARDYGARLGSLYLDQDPKKLRKVEVPATSALTGRDGGWSATARAATAEVQGRRAGPKLGAFLELAKSAWALLPSQLVPATRTEVTTALRASGAKLAEARAVVEALGGADAVWFSGKVISLAEGRLPRREGIAVFASSADGKKIGGIFVPEVGNSAEIQPREIIRELVGVDREVAVVARAASQDGDRLALEWRPLWGGVVKANLDVPRDGGAPQVSGVEVPAVLEPNLAQILRGHLAAALGAVDVA
ncbi:hypothetical protein L6R52_25305, partial [Myxococcota bacterium]|nr:hypothetical protein [Myxococcota bacterium]